MSPGNAAAVPLVARAATDVLFRAPGRNFTAADFLHETQRIAAELPETAYLFNLCRDRYCFTVAFAAALLRGQTSLLTSDQSPGRLRSLADRFGAACSVADDPAITSPLRHYQIDLSGLDRPVGYISSPTVPADHLAAIVFTSGSTGEPVGNQKSWGLLAARSAMAEARFGMEAGIPVSVVGTVPARHMYGLETTILLPLHTAFSSWCVSVFYPSDVRAALSAVPAPRVLVTTPLQLRALLQANIALPELARVISATTPLDPALATEAERRWGTQVFEIFGATEIGSIASRRTVRDEAWTAYDGIRLECPAGELVRITAPLAPPGTLNDLLDVLTPTRFRLLGRGNDIVKLGGKRASLAGLNSILTTIHGVADGVFLVPDDLDHCPTARMKAFVVAPDRPAEEILAELRQRIDPIFLPRRIVRVDALPRNELGKLPREALLALQARQGDDD
jgi:acyl-coenzyme A synthetase/AMP-(fatty) acid ligase